MRQTGKLSHGMVDALVCRALQGWRLEASKKRRPVGSARQPVQCIRAGCRVSCGRLLAAPSSHSAVAKPDVHAELTSVQDHCMQKTEQKWKLTRARPGGGWRRAASRTVGRMGGGAVGCCAVKLLVAVQRMICSNLHRQ